jgi:hypothetical protein
MLGARLVEFAAMPALPTCRIAISRTPAALPHLDTDQNPTEKPQLFDIGLNVLHGRVRACASDHDVVRLHVLLHSEFHPIEQFIPIRRRGRFHEAS